jgi:hypothetical protein
MSWHVFTWGDEVEIIKPEKLASMLRKQLKICCAHTTKATGVSRSWVLAASYAFTSRIIQLGMGKGRMDEWWYRETSDDESCCCTSVVPRLRASLLYALARQRERR